MERKFQKVGIGVGAFHNPPTAKYSEETRNLIKVLMEESKLTMMQRKSIQNIVDRGESLPPPSDKNSDKKRIVDPKPSFPSMWKKRSQDMIINSGAYEREQFRRTAPLPNKENEKRHLACIMAYGKEMPPTPRESKLPYRLKKKARTPEIVDPVDELVQGIRERLEFLNDMECLGKGKKYRPIIQQEVAQKIRLIESLDRAKSGSVREEIERFKVERPTPEPFPLGELAGC